MELLTPEDIKGKYWPVLDHGFVALVDYMGDDDAIVQAARTSYGAGTKTSGDDRGLLRYMMRHNHTSPFEMVELKFHVRLPIFVARQLIRHRTASVNEYSLRYSLPSMQFYMPKLEHMGSQSKKNRQGRAAAIDIESAQQIRDQWQHLQNESARLYELCVGSDVDLARELARLHLPLSIYTEWYWKIDLKNCLDFLRLRVDKHAQWEIQETARVKAGISRVVAPNSFEAWVDYKYQSRTFSRIEMKLLSSYFVAKYTPPEGETRLTSSNNQLFESTAAAAGLSKREWEELVAAFDPAVSWEPEVFGLNLSEAKTAAYFAAEHAKYVPAVDRK